MNEQRFRELELRVQQLELLLLDRDRPQPKTQTWQQNCQRCGIRLDRAMGYCCGDSQCPTGLGPVTSVANSTLKSHYCVAEHATIEFQDVCSWCGAK